MKENRLRDRLLKQHGTLRMAALKTGINYTRLSALIHGWIVPNQKDLDNLKTDMKSFERMVPSGRAVRQG